MKMKKNNIRIITAAAGILLLAGCSNDGGMGADADAGSITIDASIGRMTKVSADGTNFTAGDAIALYAWTGDATSVPGTRVVDGVINTFDGTNWTPASMMRWQKYGVTHYFLSLYPVPGSVTSFTEAPYTLDPADYTASDLLVATNLNGVTPSNGIVNLTFEHVMAKLGVNIKFGDEFSSDPDVTSVTVSARKNATVNYLTKSVTATGDESYVPLTAQSEPATGYKKSYSGLQVPQTIRRITVVIDDKTYIYDSASGITLTSGKCTNVGLIIGRGKMELATMSITDWEAGESRSDAEVFLQHKKIAGHEYVDMGEVIIGGVKKHLLWATCNIGADNPWDYGDYFAWGETAPYYAEGYSQEKPCTHWRDGKNDYNWNSYSFMTENKKDRYYITKYTFADNNTNGIWYDGTIFKGDNGDGVEHTDFASYNYVDDAARQIWGDKWRTPTYEEWMALCDDTKYTWHWETDYMGSGINGMLVICKDGLNSSAINSIFLPANGWRYDGGFSGVNKYGNYWSSSIGNSQGSHFAWDLFFGYNNKVMLDDFRYNGFSIRPVIEVEVDNE